MSAPSTATLAPPVPPAPPAPPATGADADPSAWRHALLLLAGGTLLRLALGAAVPLFPDETYYWDWSRSVAGGYFDHPPGIAVLIAGGTALLGDTPLGVRLLPILAGTLGGWALAAAARDLAGDRAARFTALVFTVVPLAVLGLVLATPDAPLLAGIAVTLLAVVRALAQPVGSRASTAWWALAGLAIGAAMASKFTGAFVPVALLIAFVVHPALRARFREPGPWLAVAVASVVMVPVLLWNAAHEWIAFTYQLGHALVPMNRGTWWGRELELVGGQAALLTPILFVLVVAAIWRALRWKRNAPAATSTAHAPDGGAQRDAGSVRFALAMAAAFPCAFFIYSAIGKGVSANWPAIAWLPGMILLGAAHAGARTAWERRGAWLAGILTGALLLQVVFPWLPLPPRRDQVNKAYGWDRVAAAVDSARRATAQSEGRGEGAIPIAANRYQDASMLAFHLPGRPRIPALNLGGRPNQYEIWPNFTARPDTGLTLLLVLEIPRRDTIPGPIVRLRPYFSSITVGDSIPLARTIRGEEAILEYRRIWTLRGWNGTWPHPRGPLPEGPLPTSPPPAAP